MTRTSRVSVFLLIIAGILSLTVTGFGIIGLWFFNVRLSGFTEVTMFVLPVLVFPLYITVLKSIRLGCSLVWLLLATNCAVLAIRNGQQWFLAIILSRFNEALLLIAILTQCAIYFQWKYWLRTR